MNDKKTPSIKACSPKIEIVSCPTIQHNAVVGKNELPTVFRRAACRGSIAFCSAKPLFCSCRHSTEDNLGSLQEAHPVSLRLSDALPRNVQKARQMSEVQNEAGEEANHGAHRVSGSMNVDPKENRLRRFTVFIVSRCLATILAVSFLATLLPAGTAAAKSIMACCKGQATGHCHAGFKSKKSRSISSPCHSDCCASSTAAQHQKRERGTVQLALRPAAPFAVIFPTTSSAPVFAVNDKGTQISPRGPPSFLC
jgi:hypothetical protein